ncbi:hypothetical protein [Bacillus kexueae]|uniref:hypothetical protein n=1 Tax=Aeribacillus kexueae TaxID=2078952 RepID=UPI001FAF110A|nr:hypothetical protein [Bacillus kexueae]
MEKKDDKNHSIPQVELSNFEFSPPGPMGWSFQEYEELLQNPNQFLDSQSKFTNLMEELETAEIVELPVSSRGFVKPIDSLGTAEEVTVLSEMVEPELPASIIEGEVTDTIKEFPIEPEPMVEEEFEPMLESEPQPIQENEEIELDLTEDEQEEFDQLAPEEILEVTQPVSQRDEEEWFVLTGGKTKKSGKKKRSRGNTVIFS